MDNEDLTMSQIGLRKHRAAPEDEVRVDALVKCPDGDDPHATRWVTRISRGFLNTELFTKWHYTCGTGFTLCGRVIPSMTKYGTMPEFDDCEDDFDIVECVYCRKKLGI